MTEEIRTQKSLVEQIYDEIFDILEKKGKLDQEEIKILEVLHIMI